MPYRREIISSTSMKEDSSRNTSDRSSYPSIEAVLGIPSHGRTGGRRYNNNCDTCLVLEIGVTIHFKF